MDGKQSCYIETDWRDVLAIYGDIKWILSSLLEPILDRMLHKSADRYGGIYNKVEHNPTNPISSSKVKARHLIYHIFAYESKIFIYGCIAILYRGSIERSYPFYGVYNHESIVVMYGWPTEYFRNLFVYPLRNLRYTAPEKMPFLKNHLYYLEQAQQFIGRVCQGESRDSENDLARGNSRGNDADVEPVSSPEPHEGGFEIEDQGGENV